MMIMIAAAAEPWPGPAAGPPPRPRRNHEFESGSRLPRRRAVAGSHRDVSGGCGGRASEPRLSGPWPRRRRVAGGPGVAARRPGPGSRPAHCGVALAPVAPSKC